MTFHTDNMGLARTLIRYHTQRHTNTPTENTSDQKTGTHRNIYQLHLLRYALTAATCIYLLYWQLNDIKNISCTTGLQWLSFSNITPLLNGHICEWDWIICPYWETHRNSLEGLIRMIPLFPIPFWANQETFHSSWHRKRLVSNHS